MKLPSLPLKRDPKAALASSQLRLARAEGKLSELAIQRGQALAESDDICLRRSSAARRPAPDHHDPDRSVQCFGKGGLAQDHARQEAERRRRSPNWKRASTSGTACAGC